MYKAYLFTHHLLLLIYVGEEIFGKYCEEAGPCDWFTDRAMEFLDYFKDEQGLINLNYC